jgi:hypothetical protein
MAKFSKIDAAYGYQDEKNEESKDQRPEGSEKKHGSSLDTEVLKDA